MKRTFFKISPVLLIAIVCFLAYSNTFDVSFQYDDKTGIVENRYIHMRELSLSDLIPALTKGRYANRPVAQLSFSLNYYFGKLDLFGYHLVNILVHALTGIILYFLLVITLDLGPLRGRYEKREWLALLIVLLWAVHPIQTQSVTYILQRMTSMAGMFFLLSLYLYVRGRLGETRSFKIWCYSGSAVTAILALGSKEVAGVLPLILVLYEFYFFQNLDSRVIKRKWLQIASVLVAFSIIVLIYLGPDFIWKILAPYQDWDFTLSERLLTQLRVIMYYLSLLVFPLPSRLHLDYDFSISHSLFNPVSTFFSLLGLIGMIGLGVYLARRRPLASFGIFWFLGNLVVESSIIPLELVFEHRLYLPLLGFLLFFTGIADRRIIGRGIIYGAFTAIFIFTFWTIQRNIVWKDEFSLWSDCLKKSPNKESSHNNLGIAYFNKEMYDEAIGHYQRALDIKPDCADYYMNLGIAYAKKGMLNEAVRECQQALQIEPFNSKARVDLGNIYYNGGMYDEAIKEYQQAMILDPDNSKAYTNLGRAYEKKGMHDEAFEKYRQALITDPGDAQAHTNLGLAYFNKGQYDGAIREYRLAIEINPESAKAYHNLGNAYAKKGMFDEAIREFQQALRLRPDFAEALYNLGNAYRDQGKSDEAIKMYKLSLHNDPDYFEVYNNLGNVYVKRGSYKEAIRQYQKVLEITPDHADALYNLGNAYRDQGKSDEAIKMYKLALNNDPNYAKAYNNLGHIYDDKGMHTEAIREYRRALKLEPDNAKFHINLGSAYANKGDYDKAIREYKQGLQIKPDFIEAFYNLGNAYVFKGKFAEAIKAYQQILELRPDFARAHYKLGILYHHQEQYDLSARHIKSAENLGYSIPLEFREILREPSKGLKK
ncbi:MAG: tetratricopeptide repeat protein [Deltaproteobacteria bacterium]|nr:MAG: tetratricopeptide repeat protein [Deltaproteobacteria bacterium]